MHEPKLNKLSLSQETLRNLTANDGFAAPLLFTFKCTTGLTCPECNPPVR